MRLRAKLTRHLRRLAREEDGAMALALAGLLPLMFFMLTLVEASRVYGVKNQLQATADAAAMASVWKVPDSEAAVDLRASEFAHYNMPAEGQYGDVLDNVETGNWDPARPKELRFDPAGVPENAVRVTTSGEMPLFFAGALRSLGVGAPDSFTPSAQATALLRPDKCYSNGFVAGGRVDMNSSNDFSANFCVFGLEGVTMNQSNNFAPGTEVGMADLNDLDAGGNNPGLDDALIEKQIAPPGPTAAQQLIDDLLDGNGPMGTRYNIPSWPPPTIVPGKLYYVAGAVVIDKNNVTDGNTLWNVGIISGTSITVKANSLLSGVTLGSLGAVSIDSNVVFGEADFCTTGEGQSIILSGGDVTGKHPPLGTSSNIDLYGVQMISDGTIEMNSNLTIIGASIQSSGDIVFNSQFEVAGCPEGTTPSPIHGETMVSQLVD